MSGDIQFYNLIQASEVLNYDIKNLDVPLIKYGCEIIKVPYIGGGTFIVKRRDDPLLEEREAHAAIEKQLWKNIKAIVVCVKVERNHPRFSYYQAIALRSDDILDLKKALKIHKLKAFL